MKQNSSRHDSCFFYSMLRNSEIFCTSKEYHENFLNFVEIVRDGFVFSVKNDSERFPENGLGQKDYFNGIENFVNCCDVKMLHEEEAHSEDQDNSSDYDHD